MISTYNIRPSPKAAPLSPTQQSILERYMDNLQEVSNEEEDEDEAEFIQEEQQQQDKASSYMSHSRQSSVSVVHEEEAVEEVEEKSDGEETIAGDHVEFQQQQAINMAITE